MDSKAGPNPAPLSRAQIERTWADARLGELIDHILSEHHDAERQNLPEVQRLIARVAERHGGKHPRLRELEKAFAAFADDLLAHLKHEEEMLFPLCRELERSATMPRALWGSLMATIDGLLQQHARAGDQLEQVRQLAGDYDPPADADEEWRGLCEALRAIDQDLHAHMHKENNILFLKALQMQKNLRW